MGAAASSRTPSTSRNISTTISKHKFSDDDLSRRRLKAQGMDNKEIYQHYRETYGSFRMKKKLPISENTVRALAIQKLSNTLEIHHKSYPIDGNDNKQEIGLQSTKEDKTSDSCESSIPANSPKNSTSTAKPVVKKKKPNLNISIQYDDDDESAKAEGNLINQVPQNSAMKTPREYARMSPSGGALYIGDFAINEQGISNPHSDAHHSFLTSGISDFVIIGKLGRGASGSVVEAIHIPTLTIVAIKLLPIRDSEDLHHISSELGVLYQNLAELSLLGELPDEMNSPKAIVEEDSHYGKILVNGKLDSTPQTVKSSCPQVLAMYDGKIHSFTRDSYGNSIFRSCCWCCKSYCGIYGWWIPTRCCRCRRMY